MALMTSGSLISWLMLKTASMLNHISIHGPKNFPTNLVPSCWIIKGAVMMAIVMEMVGTSGLTTRSPSMADDTLMGGVMRLSARSALPPIMAGHTSHFVFVLLT